MATIAGSRRAKAPPIMEESPAPKKTVIKRRIWKVIITVVCFIACAGAAFLGWDYVKPEIEKQQQYASQKSADVVVSLAPLQFNLSDGNGRYFLELGIKVELPRGSAREIQKRKAGIRDALIMLISGKSFTDIASPEGKAILKAEIGARINQTLGFEAVKNVYLTDCLLTRR